MSLGQLIKDRVLMTYHIVRYRLQLLGQSWLSAIVSFRRSRQREIWPELTVFISSYNTLWPLRLTLISWQKWTPYPATHLHIGENCSADGSGEYLQQLASRVPWLQITSRSLQPHGLWLDAALAEAKTPYLIFADSDLLFFPGGLLQDVIDYMEREKHCWLLESDRRPRTPYPGDSDIDCPEAISTWFFCVRTELRQQITQSFLGRFGEEKSAHGKPRVHYECGAAVLEEMRAKNLRYDVMPWWMRQKFYHFGNLSWFAKLTDRSNRFVRMKEYQMGDIERRARQLESSTPGFS